MKISKIWAQEILDSRGNPTIEAFVKLENKTIASASVPSGASTGAYEALELRDNDKTRYDGKGMLKAIKNINEKIAPELKGIDVTHQRTIDALMLKLDGTKNKSALGANAILSASLACCTTAAAALNMPLYKYIRRTFGLKEQGWKFPIPTMNIINGGKHADNSLVVQEFMIAPIAKTFTKRIQIGDEIFHALKKSLKENKQQTLVGDEGGFAPNLKKNENALDFIVAAIKRAGYRPGKDVFCCIDLALSEYFDKKTRRYSLNDKTGKKRISADAVIKTLSAWIKKYPILSLEDPLSEDDWDSWKTLTKKIGKKITLLGDDLFVTNTQRLQKGIDEKVANAILIKPNQIGTVSETLDAIYLAKKNNYKVSISHRSGETCDTFIADLALAVNANFIKSGSLSRSERLCKYNRLMEIEAELL